MSLKVGDRVKVREDLVVDKMYGDDSFTIKMKPFLGKVCTIIGVWDKGIYRLDGSSYNWTEEMLIPLTFPREMEVSSDGINWTKRVVFHYDDALMNPFLAYADVHTLDKVKKGNCMQVAWKYAREIKDEKEEQKKILQAKATELIEKANELLREAKKL